MEKDKVIEFVDWINNNWFIPTEDGYWKQDINNIEYQRTIPPSTAEIYTSEELLIMFNSGHGES